MLCSNEEAYHYFDEKWNDCTLRYGDLKKQIASDLVKTIAPIRERINEYSANRELLDRIVAEHYGRMLEIFSRSGAERQIYYQNERC